jgi:hypothetical protein
VGGRARGRGGRQGCGPSSIGLLATSDPSSFVHCSGLGPSCVKRWTELACSFPWVERSWGAWRVMSDIWPASSMNGPARMCSTNQRAEALRPRPRSVRCWQPDVSVCRACRSDLLPLGLLGE